MSVSKRSKLNIKGWAEILDWNGKKFLTIKLFGKLLVTISLSFNWVK